MRSDGLGGFLGVSQTIKLGAEKRPCIHRMYIFITLLFFVSFYNITYYNISTLSIIISLQHSNEIYRIIRPFRHYRKIVAPPNNNIIFTCTCASLLIINCLFLLALRLIFLSGDIHPNPGPVSVDSHADSSRSSTNSLHFLSHHLSIFHLNIQSLLPKIDLIRAESDKFDIAVFF